MEARIERGLAGRKGRKVAAGGACRSSFDCASRDEPARGFAQDDSSVEAQDDGSVEKEKPHVSRGEARV